MKWGGTHRETGQPHPKHLMVFQIPETGLIKKVMWMRVHNKLYTWEAYSGQWILASLYQLEKKEKVDLCHFEGLRYNTISEHGVDYLDSLGRKLIYTSLVEM